MKTHYQDDTTTLIHGDALNMSRTLDLGSVQTIVTSPPYFGLRDYGVDGQLGSEPDLDKYVTGLVDTFRELRRVLAGDGTLWLNLGDSYTASKGQRKVTDKAGSKQVSKRGSTGAPSVFIPGIPKKNLIGVPWRVAFALQADGWVLRSDIIWDKPNAMPESVRDRPTKAHEYVFLFSKSQQYFYDNEAIKEPTANGGESRNKRSVWSVPTKPFPGSHFAAYPPELIRPCILAGSRVGDTVLDPFSGSGTTGMVALQEGRKYVGIDLSAEYLDLSLETRFVVGAS